MHIYTGPRQFGVAFLLLQTHMHHSCSAHARGIMTCCIHFVVITFVVYSQVHTRTPLFGLVDLEISQLVYIENPLLMRLNQRVLRKNWIVLLYRTLCYIRYTLSIFVILIYLYIYLYTELQASILLTKKYDWIKCPCEKNSTSTLKLKYIFIVRKDNHAALYYFGGGSSARGELVPTPTHTHIFSFFLKLGIFLLT